jgi:hypothetical protein
VDAHGTLWKLLESCICFPAADFSSRLQYQASKFSAFFFVFFIVTAVFYLHSLVLSVVFQTYVMAASEIHERGVADREESVHLSYLALRQHDPSRSVISTESVRELLYQLRPHYNSYKINALVDIVVPPGQAFVDYPTYRVSRLISIIVRRCLTISLNQTCRV